MDTQIISIFMTGLLAGGISCMAVQGGLLTVTIAQHKSYSQSAFITSLPVISFLLAKLFAYTLLGFLLGWFGSVLQLSIQMQIILFLIIGVYMLMTAAHMLQIHPIFRYTVIQPPYFFTRLIRKQTKNSSIFGPALLGSSTVFIPCGTTQAIMALSIASGNAMSGAVLLFAFTLGTTPLFFLLGYMTLKLGNYFRSVFSKIAAIIIILFALVTINSAISLTGTQYTLDTLVHRTWCIVSFCESDTLVKPSNNQIITISPSGYAPTFFTVEAGKPVDILLENRGNANCASAFTIPKLGIQKIVSNEENASIHFVAPKEKGDIYFMCSQGHYRGTMRVI